jgi:RNA polymerase sigma-70 factor (ECF subfamily)
MQEFSEASDAQLVTSIGRYSEVALAEVYRRHGGAVYGLARWVLNNATEAEDVTQEVFLRLWNQPDRHDPVRGSLRSFCWLNLTPGLLTPFVHSIRAACAKPTKR